ncbi:putative Chase2 sensor protein [Scytonema sp. HK-05]|uniref:CHASE2 domain-containing protein n=1 Tax=Scytonema sp. HK-05 TaxID=1137095 RepID=UPI000935E611|nr:CHASE2 domain-containing protein [Scytonema sp. HK-05]OKH56716.1 Chase2 sensor protein [Scytonema sp. HK-05]BAY49206.1 putative Chase2 sensor protein [Scytonema sp. HK-05]
MSAAPHFYYKYQPGGSLPPNAPTYIVREADSELYNALLVGEYCYVLNSRQMGKSSLRIHTMFKLQAQAIACAEIELSGIGTQEITAQQWYGGIIQELISGFELKVNRRNWLREQNDLSPIQRLGEFIETVLLKQISQNIVIFIDEIDSVLSLNFPTDEFFALIRNCYEKRATKAEYKRLTFVLLGVATPSDLIQDEFATPFNIGRAIELKGFQIHESAALVQGLVGKVSHPEAALEKILYWTGGQPFLTQKLCWLISQEAEVQTLESINKLVHERIITNWESQDQPEHLRTIRDRLCRCAERDGAEHPPKGDCTKPSARGNRILRNARSRERLLKLYLQILQKGKIPAKNTHEHLELRLSGLVNLHQGCLIVKNPIYQAVFDRNWIKQQLQEFESRVSFLPMRTVAVASVLVTSFIIGIRTVGFLQAWELQAYDQLMQLRPNEGQDKRILLVTITEEDVQSQPITERGMASLSDRSLAQLLVKLERSQPRAIGLDIYRDIPVRGNNKELTTRIKNNNRLFVICKYGQPGISPPKEVPGERQGFNNVLLDSDDILRRHLLAVSDSSPCQNYYAFNWQLAKRYLADEGIKSVFSSNKYLQFGQTVFKTLETNTGSYQNINASGHQILLNYRAAEPIAQKVTLQEVLSYQFNPDLAKNRIVIIGTTDPSLNDHRWRTSYGRGQWSVRNLSGLEIQAHMVSQILSAVLDNRPLIWWLPKSLEFLWIWFWSLIGGLIAWRLRLSVAILLGEGITVGVLYGSCWSLLVIHGGWIPFIPSALALVTTASSLTCILHLPGKRTNTRISHAGK